MLSCVDIHRLGGVYWQSTTSDVYRYTRIETN